MSPSKRHAALLDRISRRWQTCRHGKNNINAVSEGLFYSPVRSIGLEADPLAPGPLCSLTSSKSQSETVSVKSMGLEAEPS